MTAQSCVRPLINRGHSKMGRTRLGCGADHLGKIAGRETQPVTQKMLPPSHPLEFSLAGTNGLCNGIVTFGIEGVVDSGLVTVDGQNVLSPTLDGSGVGFINPDAVSNIVKPPCHQFMFARPFSQPPNNTDGPDECWHQCQDGFQFIADPERQIQARRRRTARDDNADHHPSVQAVEESPPCRMVSCGPVTIAEQIACSLLILLCQSSSNGGGASSSSCCGFCGGGTSRGGRSLGFLQSSAVMLSVCHGVLSNRVLLVWFWQIGGADGGGSRLRRPPGSFRIVKNNPDHSRHADAAQIQSSFPAGAISQASARPTGPSPPHAGGPVTLSTLAQTRTDNGPA